MRDRWIVTPCFFEKPEPALIGIAPPDAELNEVRITHRTPPELAILHGGIAQFVASTLAEGDRPVSLAGDCCSAIGVLAGMQRAGLAPDLVWIDAHGDFNTPESSPSQFIGGMPLATIVGREPRWLGTRVGLAPLPEERVLLVGARDLDPLEAEALEASGVTRIALEELPEIEFEGPVMVHLDADILDPELCPAFAYPAPGGPSPEALAEALGRLSRQAEIAAISVTGWSGGLDRDGRTARAVGRAIEALTEGVRLRLRR